MTSNYVYLIIGGVICLVVFILFRKGGPGGAIKGKGFGAEIEIKKDKEASSSLTKIGGVVKDSEVSTKAGGESGKAETEVGGGVEGSKISTESGSTQK